MDVATDGEEGLFLAEANVYDTVLLDLMLPKVSGLEVLTRIRQAGQRTPVLVLTARDDKESVVALLNAGADDYLTKPFDLGELLARVKALIRRGKGQPAPVLSIGNLQLNTVTRTVQRAGKSVSLTAMEYRVLEYLLHRPRAVVSKTELLEHLYDYNWEKFSNVIEVYISGLRRKAGRWFSPATDPHRPQTRLYSAGLKVLSLTMRQNSIRQRLIATVVLSQLLLAAGLLSTGVFYTERRLLAALDTAIQSRAMSVAALVRYTEDASGNVYFDERLMPRSLDPGRPDLFVVWTERSGLLVRSSNWPSKLEISSAEARDRWNFSWGGVPYRALRVSRVPVLDREEGTTFQSQTLTIVYAAPLLDLREQVRAAGFFIAVASLLFLGITVLLALWGIRRGLLPLRNLATQAAAVSAQTWDFRVPEEAMQSEELRPLIDAMILMLARLQESFVQQKEFLANATHELKTPVAVLKSTLQLVLQRPRTVEEYRAGFERSLEDLERLERLLQGMLRLARADWARGTLRRDFRPVDLAATCQEAVERIRGLAEAKRVSIKLSSNGTLLLNADPEDLQLVWTNLLENAVRYSPEGDSVEIGVSGKASGDIQVVFADHGPGISAAELPHIFDRFYRGDPSRTRATGGFGLGLAISKTVIEAYGGTIRAESASEQGTRMTVELPVGDAR